MRFTPPTSNGEALALDLAGPSRILSTPGIGNALPIAPRPQGQDFDRPVHIVTYRIDKDAEQALDHLPSPPFHLQVIEHLAELGSGLPSDIILIGCAAAQQDTLKLLTDLHRSNPGRLVGALCVQNECAGEGTVELLRAGLAGVFPISLGATALANAIQLVVNGARYAPPETLVSLEKPKSGCITCCSGDSRDDRFAVLSRREREVAQLLAQGLANKEIAWRLDLQEVTIKVHTTSIYRKLGVRNRAQAVAKLVTSE